MISSLISIRSLVLGSADISVIPKDVSESISPGYTVIPPTLITRASLGIVTEPAAPKAVILPPSITSTPFSIFPCETVSSFPPLSTIGFGCCAAPIPGRIKQTEKQPTKHNKPDTQDLGPSTRDLRPETQDWKPDTRNLKPALRITVPLDNAASRIPAGIGRNKHPHRSALSPAHHSWIVDIHPRSPDPHLCPRRWNPRYRQHR